MLTHQKLLSVGIGDGGAGVNENRVTALHDKTSERRKISELDFIRMTILQKNREKTKLVQRQFKCIFNITGEHMRMAAFYKAKRHRRPTERVFIYLHSFLLSFDFDSRTTYMHRARHTALCWRCVLCYGAAAAARSRTLRHRSSAHQH